MAQIKYPAGLLASQQKNSASLDDSEPGPLITRTEINQALDVLQPYIIQAALQSATPQDTGSLMDSIITKRKQQSHLEKWLGIE